MRRTTWGAGLACVLLLALAPAASAESLSEGITIETSAGPVTCAPDAELVPGPEALSSTPFAHGTRIAIRETGALRCTTSTLGEVEVAGAGLPWTLVENERRSSVRLKGTPRPGLSVHSVMLPSLRCTYEAGKVLGVLTPGTPPSVSLAAMRVRLNKTLSSALCPALGPVSLQLSL